MGMIIGRDLLSEETPKYEVLESGPSYEIRQYGPNVVAETTFSGDLESVKEMNQAFFALARYIGVFRKPENLGAGGGSKGEAISMTAPVVTQEKSATRSSGEKIAMTAPVIMQEKSATGEKISMTAPVIMEEKGSPEAEESKEPKEATMQFVLPSKYSLQTAPKPTNPNVTIKELPGRKLAAITFYGSRAPKVKAAQAAKLKAAIEEKGYKITGGYQFAAYHGPVTLVPFRKHEIFYPVE